MVAQHNQNLDDIKRFGFAHIQSIIPKSTIAKIKNYLEQELAKLEQYCQRNYSCSLKEMESIAQSYQGKLKSVSQEDRFLFSGVYPTSVRLNDTVESIFKSTDLINLLKTQLNSEEVFAHLPAMARYILSHSTTSAVPPHRDNQYNQHMSNFLTIWIPLVDIDDQCGGVKFYQETDKTQISSQTSQQTKDDNAESQYWHDAISVEGMRVHAPHLSVGDILVFPPDTIHGSAPNLAGHTRFSLDIRVFSNRDCSTKHHMNMMTGERFSPQEKA